VVEVETSTLATELLVVLVVVVLVLVVVLKVLVVQHRLQVKVMLVVQDHLPHTGIQLVVVVVPEVSVELEPVVDNFLLIHLLALLVMVEMDYQTQ
jgi:hypothetical protein